MISLEEVLACDPERGEGEASVIAYFASDPVIPPASSLWDLGRLVRQLRLQIDLPVKTDEQVFDFALCAIDEIRHNEELSEAESVGLVSHLSSQAAAAAFELFEVTLDEEWAVKAYRHFRSSGALSSVEQPHLGALFYGKAAMVAKVLYHEFGDLRWARRWYRHNVESNRLLIDSDRKGHALLLASRAAKALGIGSKQKGWYQKAFVKAVEASSLLADNRVDASHRIAAWAAKELHTLTKEGYWHEQSQRHADLAEDGFDEVTCGVRRSIRAVLDESYQDVGVINSALRRATELLVDAPEAEKFRVHTLLSMGYRLRFDVTGDYCDIENSYQWAIERAVQENTPENLGWGWKDAARTAKTVAELKMAVIPDDVEEGGEHFIINEDLDGLVRWWERVHDHEISSAEFFLLDDHPEGIIALTYASDAARTLYRLTGLIEWQHLSVGELVEAVSLQTDERRKGYHLGFLGEAAKVLHRITDDPEDADLAIESFVESVGLLASSHPRAAGHYVIDAARIGLKTGRSTETVLPLFYTALDLLHETDLSLRQEAQKRILQLTEAAAETPQEQLDDVVELVPVSMPENPERAIQLLRMGDLARNRYMNSKDPAMLEQWKGYLEPVLSTYGDTRGKICALGILGKAEILVAEGNGYLDTARELSVQAQEMLPRRNGDVLRRILQLRVDISRSQYRQSSCIEKGEQLYGDLRDLFGAFDKFDAKAASGFNLERYQVCMQLFDRTLAPEWAARGMRHSKRILVDHDRGFHRDIDIAAVAEERENLGFYLDSVNEGID